MKKYTKIKKNMKRLSKVEKVIIATSELDKHNVYLCDEHGVFSKRKDVDDSKCLYCGQICEPIENIKELKEQYKKELGFE